MACQAMTDGLNLRLATHAQNPPERKLRRDNSSGFKGVYRSGNKYNAWRAAIRACGKRYHLGVSIARSGAPGAEQAARGLHGEFARSA